MNVNRRADGQFVMVCTANQCRSPLAAAVLRAALQRYAPNLAVESAGIAAVAGNPATAATVEAAAAIGVDLSGHRSRELTRDLIEGADLLVAMERRHVQEVVLLDPSAFGRTFTLKELIRRGNDVGPRREGESLDGWLARLHVGRRPLDLLGMSTDDDIVDPTGNALADHRDTVDELEALAAQLVDLLWPPD